MKKLQAWFKKNELFSYLLLIVIFSVVTVCLISVAVVFDRSKKTYIAAYQQSNQLLLNKIQDDYESLNENINQIFEIVANSQIVKTYLQEEPDPGQTIIDLKKQMNATRSVFEDMPSNLILLGISGTTFFQNDGVRNQSMTDFLAGDLIQKTNQGPALSQYFYLEQGLTTATAATPGLLFIRKLIADQKIYGYALIFVSEKHFASIYQELLEATLHTIQIVDGEGRIISSNLKDQLGQTFSQQTLTNSSLGSSTARPLYSYNFTLYDVFNEELLVAKMNLVKPTILITVIGILTVTTLAFFVIRKTTRPIYHLIAALPAVTQGDFSHKVQLEGTSETRELGKAYNLMLEDLQAYFDHLVTVESEKRLLEITSLQMQIQPHFIYNTLTAIKFFIWQNEQEKASIAIESFIQLLRHTLSNKAETVPLKEELAIVEAYLNILQLRYGEGIQTNIFADEESEAVPVPKMIIQPIVENIYLHAFPGGQTGFVQILARLSQQQLKIEIIDNGVGFDPQQPAPAASHLKQHYSGIGLKNIDERLKLLYGYKYGLQIASVIGQGTTITLTLPTGHD